jgi:hypothetical protein
LSKRCRRIALSIVALVAAFIPARASAQTPGTAGRSFGAVSPYIGVATTATLAVERSNDVDLDPATADGSAAYAGLSYRWRALVLSAEAEKNVLVSYAFRIGTRF